MKFVFALILRIFYDYEIFLYLFLTYCLILFLLNNFCFGLYNFQLILYHYFLSLFYLYNSFMIYEDFNIYFWLRFILVNLINTRLKIWVGIYWISLTKAESFVFVFQKSFNSAFKTGFWVQNNLWIWAMVWWIQKGYF